MIDLILSWAIVHPLLLIGAMALAGIVPALLIAPKIKEEIHGSHPRC